MGPITLIFSLNQHNTKINQKTINVIYILYITYKYIYINAEQNKSGESPMMGDLKYKRQAVREKQ